MKIITWNVNGIRACATKGLPQFVKDEAPDILCLQETKAHLEQVEPAIQTLGFEEAHWSSAKRKGYSGVATFSNVKLETVAKGWGMEDYDSEGRIVITSFGKVDLYNIYFPNGGSGDDRHQFKQRFLAHLNEHLAERLKAGRSIILVGDYNVAHREVDVYDPVKLAGESGFLPEERAWFDKFLDLGFVDTYRHLNPDVKDKYSWWSYREFGRVGNRGWRIDYISVSKDLLPKVKRAEVLDNVEGSDHCPVLMEIDL